MLCFQTYHMWAIQTSLALATLAPVNVREVFCFVFLTSVENKGAHWGRREFSQRRSWSICTAVMCVVFEFNAVLLLTEGLSTWLPLNPFTIKLHTRAFIVKILKKWINGSLSVCLLYKREKRRHWVEKQTQYSSREILKYFYQTVLHITTVLQYNSTINTFITLYCSNLVLQYCSNVVLQ